MGDSNALDISKMKVVELRKELKSRGLPSTGDKSELLSRLQAALAQDDNNDVTLDSDEIDSDVELEDIDEKNQTDILEEHSSEVLNEDLSLSDHTNSINSQQKAVKRKLPSSENTNLPVESQVTKETTSKKIILNRATPILPIISKVEEKKPEVTIEDPDKKVKTSSDINPKTKLELRAKRFGLPIKMSEQERKEARRQRFSQNTTVSLSASNKNTIKLSEDLEKLQKRAERFGQSVSKVMTEIENQERLEKRKAKFGLVK